MALWHLGKWVYQHVILFSPPTSFLFTASSWAPSHRYRLGMMRRTRGLSLSTLPTWGRHSRLWMNCGGTFPILPVPFWKELAGWASSGSNKSGYRLLVNSDSSPPTLRQSLGFLFQNLIETDVSQKSLFPLYLTPIILVLHHRGKILYGYRSSAHELDIQLNQLLKVQ